MKPTSGMLMALLALVPSATPAATEYPNIATMNDGQAIKCFGDDDWRKVYRYNKPLNEIQWYPNPKIATSHDPNWRNFIMVDCSQAKVGKNLYPSATTLNNGQSVQCDGDDSDKVYRYNKNTNQLEWYSDPSVATSISTNWAHFVIADCTGVQIGPEVTKNFQATTYSAESSSGSSSSDSDSESSSDSSSSDSDAESISDNGEEETPPSPDTEETEEAQPPISPDTNEPEEEEEGPIALDSDENDEGETPEEAPDDEEGPIALDTDETDESEAEKTEDDEEGPIALDTDETDDGESEGNSTPSTDTPQNETEKEPQPNGPDEPEQEPTGDPDEEDELDNVEPEIHTLLEGTCGPSSQRIKVESFKVDANDNEYPLLGQVQPGDMVSFDVSPTVKWYSENPDSTDYVEMAVSVEMEPPEMLEPTVAKNPGCKVKIDKWQRKRRTWRMRRRRRRARLNKLIRRKRRRISNGKNVPQGLIQRIKQVRKRLRIARRRVKLFRRKIKSCKASLLQKRNLGKGEKAVIPVTFANTDNIFSFNYIIQEQGRHRFTFYYYSVCNNPDTDKLKKRAVDSTPNIDIFNAIRYFTYTTGVTEEIEDTTVQTTDYFVQSK